MPWPSIWPEFLKKRLCRYLLQHYIGHFFKEKISLEQLSIDIYNGTGCVKNLNLDCDSLNEQLNSSAGGGPSNGISSIPIEIVSGFVGYISVYIPWHDLFNDYCKLTVKNVQITIRVKQKKPVLKSTFPTRRSFEYELDEDDPNEAGADLDSSNSSSMFSSMFIDSIMNTSMHIAQECLSSEDLNDAPDPLPQTESSNQDGDKNKSSALLGLEAFASTIDSILSRIKITLEQIQIRVENLDGSLVSATSYSDIPTSGGSQQQPFMSSSTIFNQKPSNGVALELRIKSIKYFDLDSVNSGGSAASSIDQQSLGQSNPVRNTTKSFNIEGLTVYFDEFVVRDDYDSNDLDGINRAPTKPQEASIMTSSGGGGESASLNSTIDLSKDSSSSSSSNTSSLLDQSVQQPVDESPPFNFDLNPDYYLYTNPVIMLTFSGCQSIRLTVNNMKPTDLMIAAGSAADASIKDQQRPFLEVNAQFGAIKSLLCPKQIHLLTDMVTKLVDYVDTANACKRALRLAQQRQRYLRRNGKSKKSALNKQIRGFDNRRKFESLIQNDLMFNNTGLEPSLSNRADNSEVDLDDEERFKSILIGDREPQQQQQQAHYRGVDESAMFYSMMSESTMINNKNHGHSSANDYGNFGGPRLSGAGLNESSENLDQLGNDGEKYFDDEDRNQVRFAKNIKQTIEHLQNDVILANSTNPRPTNNASPTANKTPAHNLFQTFRVSVRMFSLTVLHYDPIYTKSPHTSTSTSSSHRMSQSSSATRRFIVERMKPTCDAYFDAVSTIDTSSSSATTATSGGLSQSIDKSVVSKYHQACAFNDHFLVLLKPLNFNLVQKINQRQVGDDELASIHYSLNDMTLTVGYVQANEYLIAEDSLDRFDSASTSRKAKQQQILEMSQAASVVELVTFQDLSSAGSNQIEQPCLKVQLTFYDPLDVSQLSGGGGRRSHRRASNPRVSDMNRLLMRSFENISIQLNHCLCFELDISIVDRLFYILNNVGKPTSSFPSSGSNPAFNKRDGSRGADNKNNKLTKVRNLEVKCMQQIKVFLRFPIADLRRSGSTTISPSSAQDASSKPASAPPQQQQQQQQPEPAATSSSTTNAASQPPTIKQIKPQTMIAFRRLREQCLTLHVFDLSFHHIQQSVPTTTAAVISSPDQLTFTIVCSQINTYYQYSKRERPIHFGLVQSKSGEPRSLYCSIKLPVDDGLGDDDRFDECTSAGAQVLDSNLDLDRPRSGSGSGDIDSLKHVYNIDFGNPNKFSRGEKTGTIKEESIEADSSRDDDNNSRHSDSDRDEDDDDEDDEKKNGGRTYGPFSRIHTLISSEKNRRIVNAGNKNEMNAFVSESRSNAQMTIRVHIPQIKCLINDQRFLNDIYNCFLNDLIMWLPSKLPPIESSLLVYDAQAGGYVAPNLATLIETGNLEFFEFLAAINPSINMAGILGFGVGDGTAEGDFSDGDGENADDGEGRVFHMCKSAILKSPSAANAGQETESTSYYGMSSGANAASGANDYCESDDDRSKRKYMDKYEKQQPSRSNAVSSRKNGNGNSNNLCLILSIEKAHLKAFVCPTTTTTTNSAAQKTSTTQQTPNSSAKYGEFDVRANNFNLCVASSEVTKNESNRPRSGSKSGRKASSSSSNKQKQSSANYRKKSSSAIRTSEKYRIERQYISIYTDNVSIAHASKSYLGALKYPTNYATFESLFQNSKTKELITCNDEAVSKVLFGEANSAAANSEASTGGIGGGNSASSNSVSVPMVSIGIKSKFNSKTNIKQLLVALNFNSLTLHHVFCAQQDYWIFQLIELFNLIDIDIIGYQVPTVLTELHLNVANSCILYKPLYLQTRALVAFKSLHWSSNVTAESTHTLLVFNIEDIYLFLCKMSAQQQQQQSETSSRASTLVVDDGKTIDLTLHGGSGTMYSAAATLVPSLSSGSINLKKDWICVANSDLFELRLLINEEIQTPRTKKSPPLKSPLLDIKLRSNLIQLRTCVDSAFTLIELINYIVCDGDLHTINPNAAASTTQATSSTSNTAAAVSSTLTAPSSIPAAVVAVGNQPPSSLIESKLNVIDELSAAIGSAASHAESISPSQHDMTTFSVGTPPQSSSFKSSSIGSYSSAVTAHAMYSSPTARVPSSSQASNLSQVGETTAASSSLVPNQTKSQPIPLPTPSLSYNLKAIASASSATNNASFNLSSSAESIISDMMKEAMSSNPMLQSVYGSLESSSGAQQQASSNNDYSPSAALKNKLLGGRKRNTSLTQQSSPDLQSKRMLSHNLLLLDLDNANKDDDKTILLKEKSLNSSEMTTASTLIKESISEEKLGLMTNKPSTLYVDDEKENHESNWLTQHETSAAADEQDDDENLINLIDSNINMEMRSKKLLTDSQSSEGGELGLSIPTKTTTTKTTKSSMKPSSNRTVMNVLDDDEGFTFDMPFAGVEMGALSPLSAKPSAASLKPSSSSTGLSYSSLLAAELKSIPSTGSMQQQQQNSAQRQLKFGASNSTGVSNSSVTPGGSGRRRLYFKPKSGANRSDSESDADRRHHTHSSSDDDDSEDDDVELLKDFDIIDVIPGLGEPPRNNQDYEIKYLKSEKKSQEAATTAGANKPASGMTYSKYASALPSVSHRVEIRDDHFRKPLTKIDVLKAPDNYPIPLNVYCVQEISINWFLYGGHDFEASDVDSSANSGEDKSIKMMMNRTASSPVVMSSGMLHMTSTQTSPPPTMTTNQQQRSLANSPSLSISPHHPPSPGALSSNVGYYYSPPRSSSTALANPHVSYSPSSSSSSVVKFSTKSASLQFNKQSQQPMRKAGGRIISSLNWMHRGGRGRNLAACMEIGLHKLKTKVDLYADLSAAAAEEENNENKEEATNTCPYLYRVALAIGDIEIRDKLATSAFNMFLFRYESEQCPKHANSNMIFFKLLCSKSMDSQRLLECDIKLSVQPLRFNIDHDALIFLVEFFSKLASKDLNDFSKNLIPPIQQFTNDVNIESTSSFAAQPQPQIQQPQQQPQQPQAPPQQIFIRNFIFSPDLLIKFDFSGKYDTRPDTKMDTFTRLLMMVVQLSNTEIKLKSLCSRRGFLGVEKLLEAIKREWQADIQRNQMKNLLKGWSVFNSLIQFVEGFTYLIWYPIEQYRRDGRVLCGIQKGSAAFSTCTVLATIELTNRMFLATKNVAEFFYDLVTPHRALQLQAPQSSSQQIQLYSSNQALMEQLFPGYTGSSPNSLQRRMRLRRQPNDIRDGLTNAYYVMYEGINDTVSNFLQEVAEGAEHKGIPGAIGGALRQLPSAALAPIVLTSEATCNFLTGLRNHINPDEKRDDDYKWKTTRDFY